MIAKLKSSHFSYNVIVSLPFESILSKTSQYGAFLSNSVMSYILSLFIHAVLKLSYSLDKVEIYLLVYEI
jgi:hypothetical protein